METDLLDDFTLTLHQYIQQFEHQHSRLLDALLSCGEDFNAQLIAAYNTSRGVPTRYVSPMEAGMRVTNQPHNAQILEAAYAQLFKLRDYEEKLIIQDSLAYLNMIVLSLFLEEVQILRVRL